MAKRLNPNSASAEVIRFRKQVHRALAIEPCGETWRAVIRCQANWKVSWWSAPGERDALLQWGRRYSEASGIPLYEFEPGKGYRAVPNGDVTAPFHQQGHRGAPA